MFYSAGVSLICKFHVLGAVIYTTAPTHVKGVPGPDWIGSLSTSWALIVWDSIGKEGRGGGLRPTEAHRPRKNKGSISRQSCRVEDSESGVCSPLEKTPFGFGEQHWFFMLTFMEYGRHCSKHISCIATFHPIMSWVILLSHFTDKETDKEMRQLAQGTAGIQAQETQVTLLSMSYPTTYSVRTL